MDEERTTRTTERVKMHYDTPCPYHQDHENRMTRNESDTQKLFDKFGEAIGMLYRVEKKFEGFYGKMAGIAVASSFFMGIVFFLLERLLK